MPYADIVPAFPVQFVVTEIAATQVLLVGIGGTTVWFFFDIRCTGRVDLCMEVIVLFISALRV